MNTFNQDPDEGPYKEPEPEDFLPTEEEERLKEQLRKRRSFITKIIAICIAVAMFVSAIQMWPQLFNLSSLSFLQKSTELSQREEIQNYKKAVVTIQDSNSKGTGFNISDTGLIITNHHVIDNMNPISVIFPDGKIFHASILTSDNEIDLAILQIDGKDLPFLSLSKPDKWKKGDSIYVIGNPMQHTQIVNEGDILDGSPNDTLKISAPIYKGNSGSPVIHDNGDVVGVVYAKSTTDSVGYAIPVEKVLDKLDGE